MENIEMRLEMHLKAFHWYNSDHLIIDQRFVEKVGWSPISVCRQNAWKQDKVINADSAFIIFTIILVGQSGQVCLGDQDGQGQGGKGNEGGLLVILSGLL